MLLTLVFHISFTLIDSSFNFAMHYCTKVLVPFVFTAAPHMYFRTLTYLLFYRNASILALTFVLAIEAHFALHCRKPSFDWGGC